MPNCRWQGIEIRDTVRVLDHDLAVNQRRATGERSASLDYWRISSGPIMAMSGEGAGLAAGLPGFDTTRFDRVLDFACGDLRDHDRGADHVGSALLPLGPLGIEHPLSEVQRTL